MPFPTHIEEAISNILSCTTNYAYLSYEDVIHIYRRQLLHWELPHKLQHITWHLGDSLPQICLDELRRKRDKFLHLHPLPWTEKENREFEDVAGRHINHWLDRGVGACHFRQPEIRNSIVELFNRGNGKAYDLHAYVIMPNHIHMLLVPYIPVQTLMDSIRDFSNNKLGLGVRDEYGDIWSGDHWDRMIRSFRHHRITIDYILRNPKWLKSDSYTLWLKGLGEIPCPTFFNVQE